jgi:hypothetical protein
MARDLTTANRVVLSDLRQSFLERVGAELPGVPLETAIVDINQPQTGLGPFDLIFSTTASTSRRTYRSPWAGSTAA